MNNGARHHLVIWRFIIKTQIVTHDVHAQGRRLIHAAGLKSNNIPGVLAPSGLEILRIIEPDIPPVKGCVWWLMSFKDVVFNSVSFI